MKYILFSLLLLAGFSATAIAQEKMPARNMVIFLMDGYRWRELFEGADSAWTMTKYRDVKLEERRRKLMPFVWDTIARKGQLYGNRTYGNLVNVQNTYWFS